MLHSNNKYPAFVIHFLANYNNNFIYPDKNQSADLLIRWYKPVTSNWD